MLVHVALRINLGIRVQEVVGFAAHCIEDLRHNNDFVAGELVFLDRLSKYDLRQTVGVTLFENQSQR